MDKLSTQQIKGALYIITFILFTWLAYVVGYKEILALALLLTWGLIEKLGIEKPKN